MNNYYRSTSTIPIYNWERLINTGEVKWLDKRSTNKDLKLNNPYLGKLATDIIDKEYFIKHQYKGDYKAKIEKKIKWCVQMSLFLETSNRDYEMEADKINADIERLEAKMGEPDKNYSFNTGVENLEDFRGIPIDRKVMTVDDFHESVERNFIKAKKISNA